MEINGTLKDNSNLVENIQSKGYANLGVSCSSLIQRADCISVPVDIFLDMTDLTKSSFTHTFENLETSHILQALNGYKSNPEDHNMVEIESVLSYWHKFSATVLLSYNSKDALIEETVEYLTGTNNISKELGQNGLFFEGQSELLGLQGDTTLKVDPDNKKLFAQFRFGYESLSEGNIVLLPGDDIFNKIYFQLSHDDDTESVSMIANMGLLGLEGVGNWTFDERHFAFNVSMATNLLGEMLIEGIAFAEEDLRKAVFRIQLRSNTNMQTLNFKLKDKLKEWIETLKPLTYINTAEVDALEEDLETRRLGLCVAGKCALNISCIADCENRKSLYNIAKDIYDEKQSEMQPQRDNLAGLRTFINDFEEGNIFKVTEVNSQADLDRLLTQEDLEWEIKFEVNGMETILPASSLRLADGESWLNMILEEAKGQISINYAFIQLIPEDQRS